MNKIHNIKLNPTYEEHNFIAYLDLIITRIHTKLEADIYIGNQQLQTQQFTFFLITPQNKKMAPSRFHITRIHSLPLNPDKKQTQWKIIQSIAKNNNFPQHLLLKLNWQILNKVNNKTSKNDKIIWTTFTFHSPKIKKNYQFVQKYKYRHSVQDYNNTAPSHKTHSTNSYKNMKKLEYTKLHARPATKFMLGRQVAT